MIEKFSQNIPGFFSDSDFKFYDFLYEQTPNEARVVEIGSFKGRSSSYFATLIANGENPIVFFCVDTWQGSEEHQKGASAEDKDVVNGTLFETFIKNMEPVKGYYFCLKFPSLEAADIFVENELDAVFIDAAHDYENVKADILAWLPKIKSGGIISGHDYFYGPIQEAIKDAIGEVQNIGSCWYKKV